MSRGSKGEAGHDLPAVNRAEVVLEPAAAYLEWARGCPDGLPDLTLADLGEEGTVYLIPETDADPKTWLRRHFAPLFANELFAWCTDEACWPRERSYKTFKKFFQVRFCSIVLDLGRGPLERESA
ncbi:MAG: hypothetical protein FJ135_05210 [Deltaproteobacteria bacterium]|nr:hypothetical protein [Deltaproteobacteria bacterium]